MPFQYLMIFAVLAVVAILAVVLWRPRKGEGERLVLDTPIVGLAEPDPVLPPVLLPVHPGKEDIDALRLSPGLRGYRCDQVDGVLDALGDEIERLRSTLELNGMSIADDAAPEEEADSSVAADAEEVLAEVPLPVEDAAFALQEPAEKSAESRD